MNWTSFSKHPLYAPADGSSPSAEAATPADPAPAAETPGDSAPDLSWLSEEFRGESGINLETFRGHYEGLLAEQARTAEAQASAPEIPEAYDFSIPGDVNFEGAPEGFEFKIDQADAAFAPMFERLSEILKENGLPQKVASDMMALLGQYEAAQHTIVDTAQKESFAKLGSNEAAVRARVSTVQRAIEGRLSADHAKALMDSTKSAEAFRALEALLTPKRDGNPTPTPKAPIDRLKARYHMPQRS